MSAAISIKESISEAPVSNEQHYSDGEETKAPQSTRTKSKMQLELTDQTNLLPIKKVITIFMGLSLCILISALDSVIVATALPTISAKFQAGSTSAWVPSAYLLTSTGFQPLYGRLSDIFGRKLTLCLSMGIYILGCFAAGFSRTIQQLVIFRGMDTVSARTAT
jgi:hypothetical protein